MRGSLGINISYVFFQKLSDDPFLICLIMFSCVIEIFNSDQPEIIRNILKDCTNIQKLST